MQLSTEDSISPVTCNGPSKPLAPAPFLTPPYSGWTSIVSYFDHDSPNFLRDDEIILANGVRAQPDRLHQAYDFPAYWNNAYRQYVYYDGHNGYDFDLWYQPVYAAAPGKVIFAAMEYPTLPHSGYGNMIMISHRDAYVTLYGHFSKLLVHKGERVRRGQLLGISGNTGHSSGPHLHFTVFHNCTPTDPYGWTGGGPDPLADYKGETSMYLWTRPPLVTNPMPSWPGIEALPPAQVARYLLLRLPTASKGTHAFTRSLSSELRADQRWLARRHVEAQPDPLVGGLRIDGTVSPALLYGLKNVASIAAPDVMSDVRADFLHALAQASLAGARSRIPLDKAHRWSGYLFRYAGRTFLVGKGQKGKRVALHLSAGGRGTTRILQADAATGSYVVDLGRLSTSQTHTVAHELRAETTRAQRPPVRPVRVIKSAAPVKRRSPAGSREVQVAAVVALLLVLCAGLLLGPLRGRAKRSDQRSN